MIEFIKNLCIKAIIDENLDLHKQLVLKEMDVSKTTNLEIGHFQFNGVMKLCKYLKDDPLNIAKKISYRILTYIKNEEITVSITGSGFINFKLGEKFIDEELKNIFFNTKIKVKDLNKKKIIIDYSSPNIAKNMHVGHLRSTIIGECLSKILNYLGNKVIKISHLGDWGTQFGILIKYLKDFYINKNYNNMRFTLDELSNYYKLAQEKFQNDEQFKIDSRKEVVNLQTKNKNSYRIWTIINLISKKEYKKIYSFLNIKINYKGESFYQEMLNPIVKYIKKKRMIFKSDNAFCVSINGFKNKTGNPLPVIIQKSDGGFNYMTTDLAAIFYRIKYNKPDIIIYITDVGQKDHFNMLFELSKKLNFNKNLVNLIHIPLGLMLTDSGKKIKTRTGNSEKLIDLLKNSVKITKKITKNSKKNSRIIGMNTIKFSELSNKIDQNYIFNYEKMLKYNGKTATFIMYAYVRINSILTKFGKVDFKNIIKKYNVKIDNKIEMDLVIHILQYKYFLKKTAENLNPNILALYCYDLAEKFHAFFHFCNVTKSELKYSRFIICNIIKKIFKICFNLMGLTELKEM